MPLTRMVMLPVVGLILGTRMWYAMWDAEKDDDAAFQRRLDSIVREIGDRGKLMVPEAVTPFRDPDPAPASTAFEPAVIQAPVPAPAPASAPPMVPTPAPAPLAATVPRSTTPGLSTAPQTPPPMTSLNTTPSEHAVSATPASMVVRQAMRQAPVSSSDSPTSVAASFAEIVSFMREEREMMIRAVEKQREESEAKLEVQRKQIEAEREAVLEATAALRSIQVQTEMEAKLDAQRQEYEAKLEAQRHDAKAYISDAQLERLQERLDALHQAKLLTDDEMLVLEDKVADFIGCRLSMMTAPGEIGAAAESVRKLVGMCEGVTKDRMLARQLRRQVL